MRKAPFIIAVIIFTGQFLTGAASAAVPELANLDPYKNGAVRSLRDDISKSIYVIKSRRPESELPELKFYSYSVKKDDTFWTILARSSQDIDTLLSVNGFSTPKDIRPGKRIYIPNMRGVVMKDTGRAAVARMLRDNQVRPEYVYRTNRCSSLDKKYLFVPCGKISNLERSLFLGTGFAAPLKQSRNPRVTSRFGTRRSPFNQRYTEFHAGVDVACPRGSDVLAARDGRVIFTGFQGGYGNLVVIQHEHGYRSYYGHLSRPLVKVGDRVKHGAVIARSGNTGRTTGPHLHFEVRRGRMAVNPGILLKD
ncbi:MAG TPA: M23 family metallopeptidase [Spirochaetota bacterium]|nr:M23 family metallopeptidase [Spirochaetota bacterium]HOD14150.1 M23 family metallopeptidase [Spirochaetota bacterium]HPG49195.1 M23 family metallopeptidase [Spirochaetota bacterium]HPN10753.1 M23 family metallopeptidase [Spirochaetota bacterium]